MSWEDTDLYGQIVEDIAEDAAERDYLRRLRGEEDGAGEEEPTE